jgi:hypothetical protein
MENKYKICLDKVGLWYKVHTNFAITPTLFELISMCKGVEVYGVHTKKMYKVLFDIGVLFNSKQVKLDLSKIIDAYLKANKNLSDYEDKSILEFAEKEQQVNFLKNLKAGE